MKISRNKIASLLISTVFFILGIYFVVVGRTYRGEDKYFPMIIGGLLILTCIWMFLEDLFSKEDGIDLSKINFLAVGASIASMIAYVLLFRRIGYILSTILLGAGVILGLRFPKKIIAVLAPTIMVAIIFAIFKYILSVPLPTLFLK